MNKIYSIIIISFLFSGIDQSKSIDSYTFNYSLLDTKDMNENNIINFFLDANLLDQNQSYKVKIDTHTGTATFKSVL